MTLQIKKGNLFDHATSNCIIAHGCNAQGVMHSGFAKTLRLKYPEAYSAYLEKFANAKYDELETGTVNLVLCKDNVDVANCITQRFYGSKTRCEVDYYALIRCMRTLALRATVTNMPIHLPLIGGGLGGGDRDTLLEIFKREFAYVNAILWELE